ncbi:MAG: YggS family pyridoxal phosphate-dependent enzyme [Erysipelotrichaceae bacterium]|nr:YggS family pyridoxal phosphate-dependent enzyme [Erysipelotrichaceae bacterium]
MIVNEEAVKSILEEIKPAKLVAATKYVDSDQIDALEACGCMIYGENRVQAFLKKYEEYKGKGQWHFIGTLQTNKVKYIIDKVTLIHSVNSYKLINEIEKQAAKHDLVMDVLLQVNIAHEDSKHGFDETEMDEVMASLSNKPHIHVRGLMMMAPNIDEEETRVYFRKTKALLDRLAKDYPQYELTELSMGMSNDYHIALEEGSTMVRIGRSLFKD